MLIDDLNKALRDLETVYRFLKGKGSTIDLYADMLSGIPSENLDRCYSIVAQVVIEKIDNRDAILRYFHSCLGLDKALNYLNLVLRDLEKAINHVVEYVTMFNSLKSVQKELQYTRRALIISFVSLILTLLWYLGLFR